MSRISTDLFFLAWRGNSPNAASAGSRVCRKTSKSRSIGRCLSSLIVMHASSINYMSQVFTDQIFHPIDYWMPLIRTIMHVCKASIRYPSLFPYMHVRVVVYISSVRALSILQHPASMFLYQVIHLSFVYTLISLKPSPNVFARLSQCCLQIDQYHLPFWRKKTDWIPPVAVPKTKSAPPEPVDTATPMAHFGSKTSKVIVLCFFPQINSVSGDCCCAL